MANSLTIDASFAWTCFWQSTVVLGVGLLAARLLVRRAAHAHSVLFLASILAVAAPTMTLVSAYAGWGLFERQPLAPQSARSSAAVAVVPELGGELIEEIAVPAAPSQPTLASTRMGDARATVAPIAPPEFAERAKHSDAPPTHVVPMEVSWASVLAWLWLAFSLVLLARLIASAWSGHRLVARASPMRDEATSGAVRTACERLRMKTSPVVLASPDVACPALWRWHRNPILLLPTSLKIDEQSAVGVFCHELAHWARGDGWARLLADLAICALPWQPLLWIAAARLRQASERACDDWALSAGVSATTYADALLALVPQRRPSMALAAVSGRAVLIERIRHILRAGPREARLSRAWRHLTGAAACSVLVVAALAQSRDPVPRQNVKNPVPAASETATSSGAQLRSSKPTIAGTVADASGSAAPGATVWLISTETPDAPTIIATLKTDRTGRFEFPDDVATAALEPVFPRCRVVVEDTDQRLGWTDELRVKTSASLALVLHDAARTTGRLLDESGKPVTGASVVVVSLSNDPYTRQQYPLLPLFEPLSGRMKALSAENGSFSLVQMPAAGSVVVRIEAAGFGTLIASWNLGKPQTIRLSRAGSARGRVVVNGSNPPNEAVRLWCSGSKEMCDVKEDGGDGYRCWTSIPGISTQPDGTFEINGLPAGDYYVSTSDRDASPLFDVEANTKFHVESGRRTEGVKIELVRGAEVRGSVVDPDGVGVAGVTLTVCYVDKTDCITDQRAAQTDSDGRFVGYVRAGSRALVAIKRLPDRFVPYTSKQHTKLEVDGDMDWPQIVVKRAGRIEGVVVDERGRPVAKAEVRCDAPWDQFLESRELAARTIVCDDSGAFSIGQLDPDDNAALRARFGEAVTAEPTVIRPSAPTTKVHLELSGKSSFRLRGRVVDSAGIPVDGASATVNWFRKGTSIVRPSMGFGGSFEYIRCAADGTFESGPLWPGDDYHVQASANGCTGAESPRYTGAAGETRELEPLVLERLGGVLEGRVVDSSGAPIENARVTCGDAAGLRGSKPVLTQSDGSFRFSDVAVGLIYVFAEKDGYRFTMSRSDSKAALTITLPRDDQPTAAFDPDRGAPTRRQREAAALRILDHIWSRPDLRDSSSMLSLIMYLSRIDPDRAEAWCDELGGKYLEHVQIARFRAGMGDGVSAALPLLGDSWSSRRVGQLLDIAEDLVERGRIADALALADAVLNHAGALEGDERIGADARVGAVFIQGGRESEGKALLSASALAARDLALSGMESYWRGTVAVALARADLEGALQLVAPIEGEHEKPRWIQAIARRIAAVDASRAEAVVRSHTADVNRRDQAFLRLADAAAANDLDRAIRLSEAIGQPYYQAQAFGRLALAAYQKDALRARQLIERALNVAVSGHDRMLGFMSLGGPSFIAAALAYEARLVGHPDLTRFVNRSLSMRLMMNFTGGPREAYRDQLRTLAMLALTDPVTTREVLTQIEPRLAGLPPDPAGQVNIAHLTAWALVDPDHAADLAIAATDLFVVGSDPVGFWGTGVPAAIEVLTAAPEDRLAEGSLLILNTALWSPSRE